MIIYLQQLEIALNVIGVLTVKLWTTKKITQGDIIIWFIRLDSDISIINIKLYIYHYFKRILNFYNFFKKLYSHIK